MSHSQAELPRLYGYWRSTAAYRVRIALELKAIEYEQLAVNLVTDGGEQNKAGYRSVNPAGLVPALVMEGQVITQSMAICEFLEETHPEPALLPGNPAERAYIRALAQDVACDIHPLNNLRVQLYLGQQMGQHEEARTTWMHHWMKQGFDGVEGRIDLQGVAGQCCLGDLPGLADIFLVGQAYNADRFGFDLSVYPRIDAIVSNCRAIPAFRSAAPENQPDA